jgi:hypothetical protein
MADPGKDTSNPSGNAPGGSKGKESDNVPVNPDLEDFFNDDDLNGECYISGELGEAEVLLQHRVVVFADDGPRASVPFEKVGYNSAQATEFINANFVSQKDAMGNISDAEAAKVCWLRLLAVREGLISPRFDVKQHNVKYNETTTVNIEDMSDKSDWLKAHPIDNNPTSLHQNIRPHLTNKVRDDLRAAFTNIVSAVAYMFRVRGHHWLADMDDKYKDLWKKCLKEGDNPGVKWELIAHNALHAIMPDILDQFWIQAVAASNVAGALMKRVDAAPAGVAGVRALEAGMTDLALNVPGIKVHFKELYKEKDRLVNELKLNRWAGSINRRFYAAGDLGFDEGRFSAMAATILAALNQLAPNSPLRNSAALKRIAQNAPLTGALMVKTIVAAAEDPDNAKSLVRVDEAT